jgi:hypothetical protein
VNAETRHADSCILSIFEVTIGNNERLSLLCTPGRHGKHVLLRAEVGLVINVIIFLSLLYHYILKSCSILQ